MTQPDTAAWDDPRIPAAADDETMRAYVSRLWAEDWDSEEDTVYDNA